MKGLHNKEALNKIASQDRLDRMIVLTAPYVWVSIIAAFVIILCLFIWGFTGKLPTEVNTTGIYINSGGAAKIYSESEGFITSVYVEKGDTINEGDIIASVGDKEDIANIKLMDTRIQYVESITFDSEYDYVTADSEPLADIKLAAENSDEESNITKAQLKLKEEKLAQAETLCKEKEELLLKYKEKFFATLSVTDNKTQIAYQEASDDYDTLYSRYESSKSAYISAAENYNARVAEFNATYAEYDPTKHTEDENTQYNVSMETVNSARAQMEDQKFFMDEAEKKVKDANSSLSSARKEYLEYINSASGTAAENTVASTEYSEALTDYANAKAEYNSLLDEVDELKLQSIINDGKAESSDVSYEKQFDNQKSAILSKLRNEREQLLNKAGKADVLSSRSGVVNELMITEGTAVAVGMEVASVLEGDLDDDAVVCYIPLSDAKKVKEGMAAYIYPSTVDKQEYGHIFGNVKSVAGTIATHMEMYETLGSDSLVSEFEQNGSSLEVWFEMEEDRSTESGYHWSTNKGNDIDISQGTIVDVTIITEEKRPIDLLIPYIKDKLDFKDDDKQ